MKALSGSGEHLIICDAKQLETLHLLTCTTSMEDDLLMLLNIVLTVLGDNMFEKLYLFLFSCKIILFVFSGDNI